VQQFTELAKGGIPTTILPDVVCPLLFNEKQENANINREKIAIFSTKAEFIRFLKLMNFSIFLSLIRYSIS